MCVSDSIPASERTHTIKDLLPATYSLWVTASTAIGEGQAGQRSKVKFFIQRKQLPLRHILENTLHLLAKSRADQQHHSYICTVNINGTKMKFISYYLLTPKQMEGQVKFLGPQNFS